MTKKQKIGVAMIFIPPAVFVLNLAAFAVISFVLANAAASAPVDPSTGLAMATSAGTAAGLVRAVLGFVGIVSMIATPVGFIAGLILVVSGGEEKTAAK